jgi:hypothetical protein
VFATETEGAKRIESDIRKKSIIEFYHLVTDWLPGLQKFGGWYVSSGGGNERLSAAYNVSH